MKILFCLSETPVAPYNGFQLAVRLLADELRRDHDVRLVALGTRRSASSSDGLRVVEYRRPGRLGDVHDLARSLALREPGRVTRVTGLMAGPLQEELASFRPDVVHVSHGELARLGAHLEAYPAVLACLDAWHRNTQAQIDLASGLRRLHLRLQLSRVERFEATEYARFSHITTVTREDAAALLSLDPRLDVTPIPNGVGVAAVAPRGPDHEAPRILFHGAMGYAPNVSAARFLAEGILPLVRGTHPAVGLDLVGRKPSREVMALAELPGVHVSGEVPSLAPWMEKASVYVCPMVSGTGIKNKLLEAFAHGVPCVATPLALQGIEAVEGRDVLVGSTPEELAALVAGLLDDPDRAGRIGAAGRELVRRSHSWKAVAEAYERVYEAAIDAKRVARATPSAARGESWPVLGALEAVGASVRKSVDGDDAPATELDLWVPTHALRQVEGVARVHGFHPFAAPGHDDHRFYLGHHARRWVKLDLKLLPSRRPRSRWRRVAARRRPVSWRRLGPVIAFVGPDGAGKGTVIEGVERGIPVAVDVVYLGSPRSRRAAARVDAVGVAAGAQASGVAAQAGDPVPAGAAGTETSEVATDVAVVEGPAVDAEDDEPTPAWRRLLEPLFVTRTLLRQTRRLVRVYAAAWRGRIVLCDRHPLEALAIDPRETRLARSLERLVVGRLLPWPDRVVVLDAPAEVMFARKGEHSPARLDAWRQGYATALSDPHRRATFVATDGAVETAVEEASSVVWDALAERRRWPGSASGS